MIINDDAFVMLVVDDFFETWAVIYMDPSAIPQ